MSVTEYDALGAREQAVARAAWDEQIAVRISTLDLTSRLVAVGRPWPEADAKGRLVMRRPWRPPA